MKYYVIHFTGEEKYYCSSRVLVESILLAKKFSSKDYARRTIKKSRFCQIPFEILEFSDNGIFS